MSDSISLSQLESHLWEAANILRGPVDAADFKTYVFPLLFFKRISDVYDEEYAAALAESGGDEEYAQFPQNYRFQIPKECHWNDVRVVATNDDEKIQRHEDCYSRRFTLLESRKEPPESAKRNKTRGEISRKYGVNCFRFGRRSAFRSE
jgi:type I restriction-modification system DNA methylase subunit